MEGISINEDKEHHRQQPEFNDVEKRVLKIFEILKIKYPDPLPLLDYTNPFELLIATILAAQCTDERVNKVTPLLFKQFPIPVKMAPANLSELEEIIRSTGFFRQKAKSIKNASRALLDNYNGKVPKSINELAGLPGVGRKTANVVAGNCFGVPAIMVDTHFKQVATRLGLCTSKNPDKIEAEIRNIVPEELQTRFSLVMNYHGRFCCKARKPLCAGCGVERLCLFPKKTL